MDKIIEDSMLTKHQQLVNLIKDEIQNGKYNAGDRIPSINETSFDYLISKDTVEKAYNHLKEIGVLTSVRGKGFYVSKLQSNSYTPKALLLFNKLNPYKRIIYYSIIEATKGAVIIDIDVHHCNLFVFEELLNKNLDKFDYFVVAPYFFDNNFNCINGYEQIKRIPKEKLIILDRKLTDHKITFPGIYQDFEEDIFLSLNQEIELLKKYNFLKLIFPKDRMYPPEMVKGFKRFCILNDFNSTVIDGIDDQDLLKKGDVYIVIAETDLIFIVKKCREQKFKLGRDIGLIAFNDTPLKELLEEGITTISTDFKFMGDFIGKLLTKKIPMQSVKKSAKMVVRNSL